MKGSSYPVANDSFRTLNEGTTPFDANLANEIAAAVEAIQMILGLNLHDFTALGYGAAETDFNTALKKRARYETGLFTHPGSTMAQAVTFTNATRFTVAPLVFLTSRAALMPQGTENFWVYNPTTTGFTSLRRQTGVSDSGTAKSITYLAIEPPT